MALLSLPFLFACSMLRVKKRQMTAKDTISFYYGSDGYEQNTDIRINIFPYIVDIEETSLSFNTCPYCDMICYLMFYIVMQEKLWHSGMLGSCCG